MDLETGAHTVCKVCHVQFARYICPRCNISYCGLPCYKQHSERCTEAFYREQAVGQLKGTKADNADKKKVLRALQRVQLRQEKDEEKLTAYMRGEKGEAPPALGSQASSQQSVSEDDDDDDDDDEGWEGGSQGSGSDDGSDQAGSGADDDDDDDDGDGDDDSDDGAGSSGSRQHHHQGKKRAGGLSSTTLKRLLWKAEESGGDLSTADLESLLSPSDLRAFRRQLASGRLGHLIQPWTPWWLSEEAKGLQLSRDGRRLVHEIWGANGGVGGEEASQEAKVVQLGSHEESEREGEGEGGQSSSVLPEPSEQPLHPLASLTKAQPSPLLRYQAVELLYTYCHVMRQYNGEAVQPEMAQEAVDTVMHLSQALAAAMPVRKPSAASSPAAPKSPPSPAAAPPPSSAPAPAPLAAGSSGATQSDSQHSSAQPHQHHHNSNQHHHHQHQQQQQQPSKHPQRPPASRGHAHVAQSPAYEPPQSVAMAVLSCLERACAPPVGDIASRAVAVAVLSDVAALLSLGAPAVVLALTDLRRLVTHATAVTGTSLHEAREQLAAAQQLLQLQKQQLVAQQQGVKEGGSDGGDGSGNSFEQLRQKRQLAVHRGARGLQHLVRVVEQQAQEVERCGRQAASLGRRHALLQAAARKLWFFMCWANEHWESELFQVQLHSAVMQDWQQHQATVAKPKSKQEQMLGSMAKPDAAVPWQAKQLIVEQ